MLKIIIISLCSIILILTIINLLQAIIKADSKKEKVAIVLMLFEPADTVTYLFYIGLFGLIAGLLIL
ncbi:hypothetical protein M3603_07030 [Rummeliibacillus stabekisii]|uniref:hypothetical protein n=1 Tax=Rummeliibacillus stabekisii TaxID=241244 RepID=UPI00203EA173|nr:hypothetical protein [Rummeliibacillus stabekisii]MCM3316430.1 hypothetical protein [Rummeliibacillus stabekisii]